MSLLPIIYTSLVIFGGLFFVVLLISYISFRLKQGNKFALATNVTGKNLNLMPNYGKNYHPKVEYKHHSRHRTEVEKQNEIENMRSDTNSGQRNQYSLEERKITEKKINILNRYNNLNEYREDAIQTQKKRLTRVESLYEGGKEYHVIQTVKNQSPADEFREADLLKFYDDF